MQTFKFTDHIHYDRSEPGKPHTVYFDLDPAFQNQLLAVLDVVEQQLRAEGIIDEKTALTRWAVAIEKAFGELTLPQLLYVTHHIAGYLAFYRGVEQGFKKGCQQVINAMNAHKPSSPMGSWLTKTDATA